MTTVLTPLPGGRVFYGTIDEYLPQVHQFFDAFYAYATKWKNLFEPFALDIWSLDTGSLLDPTWEEDLQLIFSNPQFHDKIYKDSDYSILHSQTMREFFEESRNLILVRNQIPLDPIDVMKWTSLQGMSAFSKSQEVITLTYAIDILLQHCYNLDEPIFHGTAQHLPLQHILEQTQPISNNDKIPLKRENLDFIDVGAGKGYFSVFMTSEMRIRTTTIEASLSHACHLKNRIGALASQKKVDPQKFDLMDMCIGYMTTQTNVEAIRRNSTKYDAWLENVKRINKRTPGEKDVLSFEEQEKKPKVIQGELAVEILAVPEYDLSPLEFITIGLHACGDLSIVTHEIALNSKQPRGAISVPCCYQHLSKSRTPLLIENERVYQMLYGDNETKRHNMLNYALYDYGVGFEQHVTSMNMFLERGIIECFIPLRNTIKKIKKKKDENFVDYVLRVAEKFGNHPSKEEVTQKNQMCRSEIWKMMAHTVIREQFGHAFESFLLMERLTYFVTIIKAKDEPYFVGMFDVFSHLSPRAFSIFTLKMSK